MIVIGLEIIYLLFSVFTYKKRLSKINNNDFAYIVKISGKFYLITIFARILLCLLLSESIYFLQKKTQPFSDYFFIAAFIIGLVILFCHFYFIVKVKKKIKLLYGKENLKSMKSSYSKGLIFDHLIVFYFVLIAIFAFTTE